MDQQLLAAIDIGSNSFHLGIVRVEQGQLKRLISISEKVQLAAGLDADNVLSEAAQQRGLACLTRFANKLDGIALVHMRIVATNALRLAQNRQAFITRAAEILPKPIEVISGEEEARLIYLGVFHTLPSSERRLVIDIGGSSTELIIGTGAQVNQLASLQMGCLSYTQRFFADGEITTARFAQAVSAAKQQIEQIQHDYLRMGWQAVVGSSGTMKVCQRLLTHLGWCDVGQEGICLAGLVQLTEHILACNHVSQLAFTQLDDTRRAILPAGLAILRALFDVLAIERLSYSDGALREGVVCTLLAPQHEQPLFDSKPH